MSRLRIIFTIIVLFCLVCESFNYQALAINSSDNKECSNRDAVFGDYPLYNLCDPVIEDDSFSDTYIEGSYDCPTNIGLETDLPSNIIDGINALKSIYEDVANSSDIDWRALAALDYRESKNNPSTSALNGQPFGVRNIDHPDLIPQDKKESLVMAAKLFKENSSIFYNTKIGMQTSDEDLKNAFLAYNRGGRYKKANTTAESSPYVMNYFNSQFSNMSWPSVSQGEVPATAGRKDTGNYGAFTIYSKLGGSVSCSGVGGVSDVEIVAIAQKEVGTAESPLGSNGGPYISKYTNGNIEPWCADFVSWVYKEAGRPFSPTRIAAVTDIVAYMQKNGIYFKNGKGDPTPGDIVDFISSAGTHIGIVEKIDGNTLSTIEGNSSNRVSRRVYMNYKLKSNIVGFGRLK